MAPLGERRAVEHLERREGVGEPLERNSGRFERRDQRFEADRADTGAPPRRVEPFAQRRQRRHQRSDGGGHLRRIVAVGVQTHAGQRGEPRDVAAIAFGRKSDRHHRAFEQPGEGGTFGGIQACPNTGGRIRGRDRLGQTDRLAQRLATARRAPDRFSDRGQHGIVGDLGLELPDLEPAVGVPAQLVERRVGVGEPQLPNPFRQLTELGRAFLDPLRRLPQRHVTAGFRPLREVRLKPGRPWLVRPQLLDDLGIRRKHMRLQDLADLAEAGDTRREGGAQARDGRELLERRREFRPERRGGRGQPPVGEESRARLDVKDQRFEVGLDIGRVEPDAQRPQHVARPRPLPGDERRERTQAGRRSDGGGDPQLFHRRPLAAFVALEFFIERAFGFRQQTNPVRPVRQQVFMARPVEPEKFIEVWRDRGGELHRIGHRRPDRDVRLGSRPECGHQG